MIVIDGAAGEGGGQVLRTSLALALLTGKAFRIERIRARRERPGLLRQHLTAVRAAAELGGASVEGAEPGSRTLVFEPGPLVPGEHAFAVGTAGSAMLVLQTVLPALLCASAPATLRLEGGTHNPSAPPFEFIARVVFPLIRRMGGRLEAVLERPGFYPAGGGRVTLTVTPVPRLAPLELLERGELRERRVTAIVSGLPASIGERETRAVVDALNWPQETMRVEEVEEPRGPGNCLYVELVSEQLTEMVAGFGSRGVRAEAVARDVAAAVRRYLDAGVPVGEHLADQLVLLLAVAGGGRFRTLPLTGHARTQLELIPRFLDVRIDARTLDERRALVTVSRA